MHDSDPYLGAIVHYRRFEGANQLCMAALMTEVHNARAGIVSVAVFPGPGRPTPGGDELTRIEHRPDFSGGAWHWRQECPG